MVRRWLPLFLSLAMLAAGTALLRSLRPPDWRALRSAPRLMTRVVREYVYAPWPAWWSAPYWGWSQVWVAPAPAAPAAAPAERREVVVGVAPQAALQPPPLAPAPFQPQPAARVRVLGGLQRRLDAGRPPP